VYPPVAGGIRCLAESLAMDDFCDFSIKITYYKVYLGLNFCFKTYSDDSLNDESYPF